MLEMRRVGKQLEPDPKRLLLRPFIPGAANFGGELDRLHGIVTRILELPDDETRRLIEELRHSNATFTDLDTAWLTHCEMATFAVPALADEDETRRLLVGAYLTQTYAYEAAALTNPSMVPLGSPLADDQPFVMSARAIGEGHISSIALFSGSVSASGDVTLDPRHPQVSNGMRDVPVYSRQAFSDKLTELGFMSQIMVKILSTLPEGFESTDLDIALIRAQETDLDEPTLDDAVRRLHWLAASNYRLTFDHDLPLSEHVISPAAPAESRGMEDARFVRFTDESGGHVYYATYTAYDGVRILPQLIETSDFVEFRIATMTGPAVHHKGMAIFPRRIHGEYVALSRHDQESSYVLRSDDIRRWSNAELAFGPELDWELVQTGNCGSPIETEAGWLVITHGVGPMRRYVLGAVLLDLDEPAKVVGRLRDPLLEPEGEQVNGYVPNVVYSCGSMLHAGNVIIPFGYADHGIDFAITPLESILAAMT